MRREEKRRQEKNREEKGNEESRRGDKCSDCVTGTPGDRKCSK